MAEAERLARAVFKEYLDPERGQFRLVGDGDRLRLEVTRSLLPLETVKQFASKIVETVERGLPGVKSLEIAGPPPRPAGDQEIERFYTYATCYLKQPGDQTEAIERVERDLGLTAEKGFLAAILFYEQVIMPLQGSLVGSLIFVASLVSLNLGVTFWQRIQHRRAEIGILKANGMSRWQLTALFVMQSAAIGTIIAGLGTVLAYPIGLGLDGWFARTNSGQAPVFLISWQFASILFIGLVVSASLGGGIAAWFSSRLQAAEAVR